MAVRSRNKKTVTTEKRDLVQKWILFVDCVMKKLKCFYIVLHKLRKIQIQNDNYGLNYKFYFSFK